MGVDRRKVRYLSAMGIPVWYNRRGQAVDQAAVLAEETGPYAQTMEASPEEPTADNGLQWETLQQEVSQCRRCGLCETRTQTVFGVGNRQTQWVFVGEAPGADEDRQGEPFVGRAGQLLTQMIRALGMDRGEVYIANILKCRPPNNRDPLPDEVAQCESYLLQQLALLKPKIIVALGRVAAQNLLKTDERIGVLRGRRFYYGEMETPLVVTYHPAYLLRSPKEKRKAWQDLCLARNILEKQDAA